MTTNMVLNGFEGKERTEAKGVMCMELTMGSKTLATTFFIVEGQGIIMFYWAVIGFMLINVCHLPCINS